MVAPNASAVRVNAALLPDPLTFRPDLTHRSKFVENQYRVAPANDAATTAISGRYIRCSNMGCNNGITDDVGANMMNKPRAQKSPSALFRQSSHTVTINKMAISAALHPANSRSVGGCYWQTVKAGTSGQAGTLKRK